MINYSFSKNTIIYLIGGVVAAGGNILLAPIYLRVLSAEDFGAWSQFNLMLQFLQPIMCWGLLATMARLIVDSDKNARSRKIAAALIMATVLNGGLLAFILGAIKLSMLQPFIASQRMNLLPLAVLAAGLTVYPTILMGLFVADGKALQYRSLSLVSFFLQATVLGVCSSQFIMDVKLAILAMLFAASLYAVLSIYLLIRQANWCRISAEYKPLIMYGVPLVVYAFIGQVTDFIVRFTLAEKVNGAEFGAFSAGILYASVISMISSAINLAWVPLFFRNAEEWVESGVYRQFVNVFTAVTATFGAFLIIFSSELIATYSNGKISLERSIIGVLVITSWFNSSIWMSIANPLFHQKRTKTLLLIVSLAAIFSVPICWFLSAEYGIFGAAIALLSNALLLCLFAAAAQNKIKMLKLNYRWFLMVGIMLIIISSPIEGDIFQNVSGIQKLSGKGIIFIIFASLALLPLVKSTIKILNEIKMLGEK